MIMTFLHISPTLLYDVTSTGRADDTWWQTEVSSKFKFEASSSGVFTGGATITNINGQADPFVFDTSEYYSTLSSDTDFRTIATYSPDTDYSGLRRAANPTRTELDSTAQALSDLLVLCSFDGATCTAR